ncbi:DUF1015 domain-containing protein [Streptomyces johnsoniae]|uniref:DUF1015 domain-containing protein n=1 Tax=Streptomyces johnsoniae TaxID=3075532 RepID=A0ABU2S9I2_9ACTN|nr:DUF1015 domain-containing protein [Streptomyces sp. DSM 41886]MDT0445644.1 DUF1015 domain-containing protein [Streptomyces sp. DSM 41886]
MHAGLDLAPFRALRYAQDRVGSLAAVTSPPYDVVVRPDGLRELQTADRYNIVRLILPQADDPAAAHRDAARTLRGWRAEGVLAADQDPAVWVYEQHAGGTLQRGLIGALALSPPEAGVVLPHEDVMPDVVEDRAALMRATAANLEPLLLACHGTDSTTDAVERTARRPPLLATTTADGTRHRLWPVTEPAEVAALTGGLKGHRALIADGHHRWATYLRLSAEHEGRPPWDRGLVLLVDTARYPLRVQPIHRVLPTLPPAVALARLNGAFRTRRLDVPAAHALDILDTTPGTAFLLAGEGHCHLLDRPEPGLLDRTVRHDRPPAWRRLDATVLHAALLGALWRADVEPGTVRHLHDANAAVAQAERAGGSAVLMRAVAEPTVRALAEAGVTMPHKSTSFGPKPATGLLLRPLDIADEN